MKNKMKWKRALAFCMSMAVGFSVFSSALPLDVFAQGENTAVTQQHTNNLRVNRADLKDKLEPVKDVIVEIDYVKTNQKTEFKGGQIKKEEVDEYNGNATFEEAFVLDEKGNRFPIEFAATINGKVYYAIQELDSEKGDDLLLLTSLGQGQSILFSYLSKDSVKHNITFDIQDVPQVAMYGNEGLPNGMGRTEVLNKPTKIVDGSRIFFQIKKIPGTEIKVQATIQNSTKDLTPLDQEVDKSDIIERFSLEDIKGDVKVTVRVSWKNNGKYNVNFQGKTLREELNKEIKGTYYVGTNNKQESLINVKGTRKKGQTKDGSNQHEVKINDKHTVQLNQNEKLENNYITYEYISNEVHQKKKPGHHHMLASVIINGEAVKIPDTPTGDKNLPNIVNKKDPKQKHLWDNKTERTVLVEGDAKGTVVTVTRLSDKAGSYNGGNEYSFGYYPFAIKIENIHSDLDVQVNYAPYGTQNIYTTVGNIGTIAEIHMDPDWKDPSGKDYPAAWYPIKPGNYYYAKNTVPSNLPYEFRWKSKPGYKYPVLTSRYKERDDIITTAPDKLPDAFLKYKDGWYIYRIPTLLRPSNNEVTSFSFEAKPKTYRVEYKGDKINYPGSIIPEDMLVYNAIYLDRIVIDSKVPYKKDHIFTGYKIKDNKLPDVRFFPGDVIDITNEKQIQLDDKIEKIILEPQFEDYRKRNHFTDKKILVKMRKSDENYEEKVITAQVLQNSEYILLASPEKTNGADQLKIDVQNSTLNGTIREQEHFATVVYEHPTKIQYEIEPVDGIMPTGSVPALISTTSFREETLSSTELTLSGYKHTGWKVKGKDNQRYDLGAKFKAPWDELTLVPEWTKEKAKEYRVTFDENGGDQKPKEQTVEEGKLVSKPEPMPTKEGHKLVKWVKVENGQETEWDFAVSKMPARDITLKAIWEKESYNVTFDADGGTPANLKKQVKYGELITEPQQPKKENYRFDGWYINATNGAVGEKWDFTKDKMPAHDVVLKAKWVKEVYAVTFDPDGGNLTSSSTVKVKVGEKVKKPEATKDNFLLVGWRYENENRDWNFDADTMPARDITLKAVWKPITPPVQAEYTVTFDADNGMQTTQKTVKAGEKVPVLTPAPTKTGHKLVKWVRVENGKETEWDFENNVMPAHNITLKAIWEKETYKVIFDTDGGQPQPPVQNVVFEGKVTKPAEVSKEGYRFLYWAKEGTNTAWDFNTNKMPAENLTLKAIWEQVEAPKPMEYTVTFDVDGGMIAGQESAKYKEGAFITEPTVTKDGYTLTGWNYVEENRAWDFQKDTMPAKDITLKAMWKELVPMPSQSKVTFELDNGSNVIVQLVTHGTLVPKLSPEPTKRGHQLVKWVRVDGQQETDWNFEQDLMPEQDITLRAIWEKQSYEVSFDAAGGQPQPNSQNVKYGELITEPQQPTKEGYLFGGWYEKKPDGSYVKWDFAKDTMPDYQLVLTVQWMKQSYQVTFDTDGGMPQPAPQMVEYQSLLIEPEQPTKQGYRFAGWYLQEASQAKAKEVKWDFTKDTMPAHPIQLKAKWQKSEANEYQVVFDTQGGTPVPAPQTVKAGEKIQKPAENIMKDGFVFSQWIRQDTQTVWNFDKDIMPEQNIVLLAQWTAKVPETNQPQAGYVVHFDTRGGSAIPSITVPYNHLLAEPQQPTKEGYRFAGWYADSEYKQPWVFATNRITTSPTILYAKWVQVSAASAPQTGDTTNFAMLFTLLGVSGVGLLALNKRKFLKK